MDADAGLPGPGPQVAEWCVATMIIAIFQINIVAKLRREPDLPIVPRCAQVWGKVTNNCLRCRALPLDLPLELERVASLA